MLYSAIYFCVHICGEAFGSVHLHVGVLHVRAQVSTGETGGSTGRIWESAAGSCPVLRLHSPPEARKPTTARSGRYILARSRRSISIL